MRLTTSAVPTRQGVQKPQLSCAKKCAKPRATSNMSRLRSNTMKAPAVGTSSNAMRRPNSKADRHTPDGPPTCTACVSRAPQSSRMRPMRVPNGYSYKPGRSQSPETEWILVPVDFGVPMPAHQAPPYNAMWPAAQKVSTLLTMVGKPR